MKIFNRLYRRACVVFIVISSAFMLTGCWDRLELEEQAYVFAIGVDFAANNKYAITYQIAGPSGGGLTGITGSSSQQPSSEIVTFIVPDIISARDLASISITRRPSFTHTQNIIISEDVAKSDKFFGLIVSAIRNGQIRRDSFLIISKEKAADFIRGNDPKLESRPHKFYEFMSRRWQESGLVPFSNINQFIQIKEEGEGLFLTNYGTIKATDNKAGENEGAYKPGDIDKGGGNPIEIIGSCVFKDGKMVDSLDGEDTRISLILQPYYKINTVLMTFKDPLKGDDRISTNLTKNSLKVNMNTRSNPLKIDVLVDVDIMVLGIPSRIDYVENLDNQEKLRTSIENELAQTTDNLVKKTQQVYGEDPFHWYQVVRGKFLTLEDYRNYDYKGKYKDAQITVKYKVTFEGFGQHLTPPQ